LPKIGKKFGYLKPSAEQEVICVYIAKGGVLKTTLSYCLARTLALNGLKTIIIGLDIQCSVTELAIPTSTLEDAGNEVLGLYHFLFEDAPLADVIQKTSLPTLDILPETTELSMLEKKIRHEKRREYIFQDQLLPQLSEYDVILFDNSPSWNQLIENSLVASSTVLSPAGCDLGTYKTLQTNLGILDEFRDAMRLEWKNFLLVPTLLERTKLSQQILEAYQQQYGEAIVPTPIRRGVKGQEALVLKQTPIEYDPTSTLAQDYFAACKQIWNRIRTECPTQKDEYAVKNAAINVNQEVDNGLRI